MLLFKAKTIKQEHATSTKYHDLFLMIKKLVLNNSVQTLAYFQKAKAKRFSQMIINKNKCIQANH